MKIGYARVSTHDQNLALQHDALQKSGCEQIYEEKMTGATSDRPQLQALLAHLRPGDVVVVWKLDRLARSLKDLVELVNQIQTKGAALHSLHDQIDTTTPHGKFTFHLFAALAEFERDLIRERTQAGLAAARARGRQGGRPKGLSQAAQDTAMIAAKLYADERLSVKAICERLGISKNTLYAYLRHQGVPVGKALPKAKIMPVSLWLNVQGHSKFVRGEKKARQWIEQMVLQAYQMEKLTAKGWEYHLSIPYEDETALDRTIAELVGEASRIADLHDCFIEAHLAALDGSERGW